MSRAELLATAAIAPQRQSSPIEDDGFYDLEFVRSYYGGNRPLHAATIWRGVKAGRYPPPRKTSPNVCRWLGRELRVSKEAIINGLMTGTV